MHIAEGVFAAPVIVPTCAVAAAAVAWGLKKLPGEKMLFAGFAGAVFFIASLIHVPVGVSSAHLVLNGLLGVLFGAASYPIVFCALVFEALFFQFGGLTVLGLNTLTMGTGALAAGLIYRGLAGRTSVATAGAAAGFAGVFVSAILVALALALTDDGFLAAAAALLVGNFPVMAAEAVITPIVLTFVAKTFPELLE